MRATTVLVRMVLWVVAVLVLPAASAAADPMRVALGDGLRAVEVGAADLVTLQAADGHRALFGIPGGRVIRLAPSGGAIDLAWGPSPGERRRVAVTGLRLSTRRGPLRVGTRDYGAVLEVWRTADGLLLVNELPLEEYVAGTVRAETSERWPAETLRAMAVVARSFAIFLQQKNVGKPYHVLASSLHQNYAGRVPDGSPAAEASRTTAGQVLTWQGVVFPTFYHSDSGGFTEPPQLVFSGDGIPPLPGVRDEFAVESPNYSWSLTLPLAVVGERLRQGGLDVGEVSNVSILERSSSLRVTRLAVQHSRGTTTLKGTDFRRLMGYDVLKSTLFVPVVVDRTVRFEGRGWGHGAGLSQFGAKGMADRGYTYREILAHYYPGSVLQTLR
jgi:stage II sporulation protein D